MASVLITGCNGTVGRHLTQVLFDAGHDVIGASLEANCFQSGRDIRYVQLDITDYSATQRLLTGRAIDAIVHLAALVHVRNRRLGFADYDRVNHRASEHLFREAANIGIERFLFTSTIEVYGTTPPNQLVTEDTPCHPESDYAKTKLLAEEALAQVAQTTSSAHAILRLAPVYAAGFRLNLDKRLYLRKPVGYRLLSHDYRLAMCSVWNIGHFVSEWLTQVHPMSGIFNLADSAPYSISALLQRERLAGRCKIALPLPYAACSAGLVALQTILSWTGRKPGMLSVANLHKLVRSANWDTLRATTAVGALPWTIENTPGFD